MKITRYGNTETHLLFINYLFKYENIPDNLKEQLQKIFMTFVNYHYTDQDIMTNLLTVKYLTLMNHL